jgi:hypothetical protein
VSEGTGGSPTMRSSLGEHPEVWVGTVARGSVHVNHAQVPGVWLRGEGPVGRGP